ncbi:MAG: transposase family protein [Planctomycetota bacterium]
MTTRELYGSIGVSGYEHEGCWRKDGIFHIRLEAPRLECRRCKQVLNRVLPNVVPRCNYTKAFARHAVDLRKMMTIRDVARYVGVIRAVASQISGWGEFQFSGVVSADPSELNPHRCG